MQAGRHHATELNESMAGKVQYEHTARMKQRLTRITAMNRLTMTIEQKTMKDRKNTGATLSCRTLAAKNMSSQLSPVAHRHSVTMALPNVAKLWCC
jgi:hypothetical protein